MGNREAYSRVVDQRARGTTLPKETILSFVHHVIHDNVVLTSGLLCASRRGRVVVFGVDADVCVKLVLYHKSN